jgi:beta-amylase
MAKTIGLKMKVVMSFHKCGTNVGDACYIELPSWIRQVGNSNPDIYYTDREGYHDQEYLTLGVDNEALFGGRTAVDCYTDFMRSFAQSFSDFLGQDKTITVVEVGLGPAGELRYPSYQLQDQKWSFPGIGEFQSSDKYMLAKLKDYANKMGKPQWGYGPPNNAGNYNSVPDNSPFFSNGNDNWNTEYGRFFLSWYSHELIQHGDTILGKAASIFAPKNVRIAAKVAGIHWWYFTDSHAAESTAGYYNSGGHDGYKDIATMLKKHNAMFLFTCLEMRNSNQPAYCKCGPENLVQQTRNDAWSIGVDYAGENALPAYDDASYDQIVRQSFVGGRAISGFTYLRMDNTMLSSGFQSFARFVNKMHNLSLKIAKKNVKRQ